MRDLQRLERLSSATALGLWAEDVILALDRLTRLREQRPGDLEVLQEAASLLDAALNRSERPLAVAPSTNGLAATNMALDIAETLSDDRSPQGTQEKLRDTGNALREAVAGNLEEGDPRIDAAFDFFSAVGRRQLAASNTVSGQSRGSRSWMAAPMTFNFS
jgi:hypothetical protein